MNLLILTTDDSRGNEHYEITDHRVEHIRAVLKRGVGEVVQAGLLDGDVGDAEILTIDERTATLRFTPRGPMPLPPCEINLICAISRPPTVRKVLLTAATMGVRAVHLVRANRTERSYLDSPMLTADKMRPVMLEGLSQGKFTRLPKVTIHLLFRPFAEDTWPSLEKTAPPIANRLLCEVSSSTYISDIWNSAPGHSVLAIGPEGGWVPFEIEHFMRLGFTPFYLGPWVLRVESAVTAALAQIELIRAMRV